MVSPQPDHSRGSGAPGSLGSQDVVHQQTGHLSCVWTAFTCLSHWALQAPPWVPFQGNKFSPIRQCTWAWAPKSPRSILDGQRYTLPRLGLLEGVSVVTQEQMSEEVVCDMPADTALPKSSEA